MAGLPGPFEVVHEPRMHMTVDLSKEKFSRQQSQLMTWWYGAGLFSARREAIPPLVTRVAGLMPPVAEKTKGVNDLCSTSNIRCWYVAPPLFILVSWVWVCPHEVRLVDYREGWKTVHFSCFICHHFL